MRGIDISKWQGANFSLAKAKQNGEDFAIIRIGVTDANACWIDPQFENYYKQAIDAGLKVGVYYYANAVTIEQAETEAEFVIEKLAERHLDLPIYYDVESLKMQAVGKTKLTAIIQAFGSKIESEGYKKGLYMSLSFFDTWIHDDELRDFSHWVAYWRPEKPALKSDIKVDIWQTGSTKNYQGNIEVDNDIAYFAAETADEREDWITQAAREVWEGLWGNGEGRKQKLYEAIQRRVEELKGEYI